MKLKPSGIPKFNNVRDPFMTKAIEIPGNAACLDLRDIPRDEAQRRRPPYGNRTFYEIIIDDGFVKVGIFHISSPRRRPGSSKINQFLVPAFAGMTMYGLFTKPSNLKSAQFR